jgi:plastocyanin
MRHGPAALLLGVAMLLVLPALAPARTKTIEAGPFGRAAQRDFQAAQADANAFFRRTVTIREGDRVRWRVNGFHNILFPARGDDPPALVTADPARPVTGINDAAGAPFWFNGQPSLAFDPLVAFPQGNRSYDGRSLRASGLPLEDGPPEPYTLRFTRRGTYNYYCDVHAGMRGTVRVLGSRGRVPTNAQDKRAARRELQARLRAAERLTDGAGTQGLQNTVQAGNDDRQGTAVFKFFPAESSYRVGETVTLQMPRRTGEVHTFTFGPSNGRNQYVDQIAQAFITPIPDPGGGPPTIGLDPRAAYPSENPATGVPSITSTMHSNGYYNTGILDGDPASPVPGRTQVRFGAPGNYSFICLIHPFMQATIEVTS